MEFSTGGQQGHEEVIGLFAATFTASEGPEEGTLIAGLVRDLLNSTADEDLFVFTADGIGDCAAERPVPMRRGVEFSRILVGGRGAGISSLGHSGWAGGPSGRDHAPVANRIGYGA